MTPEQIWSIEHRSDALPESTSLVNAIPSIKYEFDFTASYITKCFENGESFVTSRRRYSADLAGLMAAWRRYHGGAS